MPPVCDFEFITVAEPLPEKKQKEKSNINSSFIPIASCGLCSIL